MSRQHYVSLDGLRGVAALSVAAFHVSAECGLRDGRLGWFSHGYLAVDFFFCLSGLVVAQAYTDRLSSRAMSFGRFCLVRAVRLWPLLAFVALIACLSRLTMLAIGPAVADDSVGKLLLDGVAGVLMVPMIAPLHADTALYPLNGPAWSVFYEFAINVGWAALLVRARAKSLAAVAIALAAFLLIRMLKWDTIHFGYARGFDMITGAARVGYTFCLGVLIYRFREHAARLPKVPFEVLALAILLVLVPPYRSSWVIDMIGATAIFPAIVFLGLRSTILGSTKAATILGETSFPLYAVHVPILVVVAWAVERRGYALNSASLPILLAAFVAAAWLAHRYFDVPVRAFLTKALLGNRGQAPKVSALPN